MQTAAQQLCDFDVSLEEFHTMVAADRRFRERDEDGPGPPESRNASPAQSAGGLGDDAPGGPPPFPAGGAAAAGAAPPRPARRGERRALSSRILPAGRRPRAAGRAFPRRGLRAPRTTRRLRRSRARGRCGGRSCRRASDDRRGRTSSAGTAAATRRPRIRPVDPAAVPAGGSCASSARASSCWSTSSSASAGTTARGLVAARVADCPETRGGGALFDRANDATSRALETADVESPRRRLRREAGPREEAALDAPEESAACDADQRQRPRMTDDSDDGSGETTAAASTTAANSTSTRSSPGQGRRGVDAFLSLRGSSARSQGPARRRQRLRAVAPAGRFGADEARLDPSPGRRRAARCLPRRQRDRRRSFFADAGTDLDALFAGAVRPRASDLFKGRARRTSRLDLQMKLIEGSRGNDLSPTFPPQTGCTEPAGHSPPCRPRLVHPPVSPIGRPSPGASCTARRRRTS